MANFASILDQLLIYFSGDNKEYKLGTVKGQFIYACVIITPLDQGSNRVEIQCLPLLEEPLEHIKVKISFFKKNI